MNIKELIKKNGPITVAQFMAEVLPYYYGRQEPFGSKGDFTTAPEISQVFGEMLGLWVASMWQQMGAPAQIAVAEFGPGRGTLMLDFLRGTGNVPGFHDFVEVHMVETSERLQEVQKQTLKGAHDKITWHKDISTLPNKRMFYISNEFFDALPIHQYVKTDKGWCERMVGLSGEELEFCLSPVVSFSEQLEEDYDDAPLGGFLEVNQMAISIIEDIALRVKEFGGGALFVDYGYDYYGYKDTLQAVKDHKYADVLKDVGEADITAHVDFSVLYDVAEEEGAQMFDIVTQRDFLLAMGIEYRKTALLANASEEQKAEIESGIDRLVGEDEMGTLFKVLAFLG